MKIINNVNCTGRVPRTIELGFLADFVLLSSHPKEVADFKIQNTQVEETWSRGERVYIKTN